MFMLLILKSFAISIMSLPNAALELGRGVVKAWEHRRQVRALGAYDDRMLKDIGLYRSDVDAALDAPIFSDPSQVLTSKAAFRKPAMDANATRVQARVQEWGRLRHEVAIVKINSSTVQKNRTETVSRAA